MTRIEMIHEHDGVVRDSAGAVRRYIWIISQRVGGLCG